MIGIWISYTIVLLEGEKLEGRGRVSRVLKDEEEYNRYCIFLNLNYFFCDIGLCKDINDFSESFVFFWERG